MILNNYYRLKKDASKIQLRGAYVTDASYTTLSDVKTKQNTSVKLLDSYNSYNDTNKVAGYAIFISYSEFFTVHSVEFSNSDNPNFQKNDYCLANPIEGITNIVIGNNYIDTEEGLINVITITGHNNNNTDITLKNFGLYHNVKYMETYYSGQSIEPVLIAEGTLDHSLVVPADNNFSITIRWVES